MINASIVLYHPQWEQVVPLTQTLLACKQICRVFWIDNSPHKTNELPIASDKLKYVFNNHNLGYGAAHNIAIRESIYDDVPFHLVVNPDITFTPDTINTLLEFILQNPEVGMVSPKITYQNGELQHLCKLLPTPLDVFGRRFLPQSWMVQRNQCYEMRSSGYDRIMNVPYLSGCFMLLRTQALQKVRLFDERFFMYPEDIDLTRRIHRDFLTVYYPHVTIIHNHEKASYKSLRMLWIHTINMCRYFNKWGWFSDKERDLFNATAIKEYL